MKSTISSNSSLPDVGGLTNFTSLPTAVNSTFGVQKSTKKVAENIHFCKIFANSGYVIFSVITGKARLLISSRSLCLNNASTAGPKSRVTHVILCSDEALYFGIASSKVPDEVLVNAPNLIHHETEEQGKQLDTVQAYFQRSSVNQPVSTVAFGTPDDVKYSSMMALSTPNE